MVECQHTDRDAHTACNPSLSPSGVRPVPEEKLEERLHLGIIKRLVPEWADVPFYKAAPADATRMTRPRIWESGDRQAVEEILAESASWDDVYDVDEVRSTWSEAVSSGGSRHEMLIQRVVWRATFGAHLRMLGDATRSSGSSLGSHEDGTWVIVGEPPRFRDS